MEVSGLGVGGPRLGVGGLRFRLSFWCATADTTGGFNELRRERWWKF